MHSKFLALISLSMYLGSCCCSSGTKTITPLNCSNNSFNCGDLAYISYPFWGGAQPSECGLQGYEIVCKNNTTPTLKISSLSYRITNLDFTTNTLTVAREDLLDTYCPDHPHNTTIDWNLFYYPLDSTDRNLTLFYNCTAHSSALPNAFTCANRTSNLFSVTDAPGNGVTCDANIYVPIDFRNAQSLQNPTPSSINILHLALTDGFSIRWYEDKQQRTIRYCNSLLNASCSPRNPNKMYRSCNNQNLCTRGYAAPVPSPTSSARDMAPVPSPTSSATGMAPVPTHPSEYGLPPASSTHYHPQGRGRNPHNERSDGGGKRAKEIIIVVALGVAGIITMSISIHCFQKRRHSPNQQCKHDMEKFLLQQGSLTPKRYRYSEIKKITKFFSHKLGQGGYGSVYKGLLPDGCPVAVKTLTDTDSNGEEFVNEVASISRTCHVNIVALLGFCYESNRRALVYEFMPNSSLDKFLNHNQSAGIMDLEKLYMIAVGVAKGLEYLHNGCNTRIIHFDIKPQNILLDEDLCPKISDFGLAKLCKKKQSILSVLGTRGTAGYIAPEVFSRNFGEVSHKSDVYSYGMMLLEMAGAGKDGEAEAIQSSENYISDKIYEEVIVDDLMMTEGEEETRKKMFVVGFWCIQTIPSSRPSISKVVEMLEGSLEAIQIPPKPFLFSPNLPIHEISSSLSAFVEAENSAQCLDAS